MVVDEYCIQIKSEKVNGEIRTTNLIRAIEWIETFLQKEYLGTEIKIMFIRK
jgi:hypothetical protein